MKTKLFLLLASFLFSVNVNAVDLKYGVATEQNRRDHQEDRHRCAISIRDNKHRNVGKFFGVYDGHGGSKTSSFLAEHLHYTFSRRLRRDNNIAKALNGAFLSIDWQAIKYYSDGSTAVAAYLDNETNILHYAWAGDSRLVVHNGPATKDHKPNDPQEKERIEKAGGKVEFYGVPRVNGLAVARAIGDKSAKKAGKGQVIATPEYDQYQLTPANEFMILASDGIWDKVSNEDAISLVKAALKQGCSSKTAASILKDAAIKAGSGDNITAMVVHFDWNKE
jgi:protein phosphatase 1L